MEEIIRPSEDELMAAEEKCRKAMKTVTKAIIMRLSVTGLLLWITLQSGMELWAVGLITLVLLINLSGLLPLGTELRKRLKELNSILDQYE